MGKELKDGFGLLVLAAGMGTRMKSELPKVLHSVGGRPLLGHVLRCAATAGLSRMAVVAGHCAEAVTEAVARGAQSWGCPAAPEIVLQKELSGSGRAAFEALPFISSCSSVLVLCGDAPLVRPETLAGLMESFKSAGASATVLTAEVPDPSGYGRIIRNGAAEVERIVEHADAGPAELAVREINSGMYVFDAQALARVLPKLTRKGAKREYYLTDAVELLRAGGGKVTAFRADDYREILGINSRAQLAEAAEILRRRVLARLMDEGVTVLDPASAFVDDTVRVGRDTVLHPCVFLCGDTVVGQNCSIGPCCQVRDSRLEDGVRVLLGSCLDGAQAGRDCAIGPFSHLRPQAQLRDGAKVGNFSEVKKSVIGAGSKVNHLSYVGDATVGAGVNIGAGTITCNYDGVKKHPTVLGDGVFVGSNVNLVAPVTVGAGALLAAGSTITEDVPEGTLAIARQRQVVKPLRQKV